MPIGILFWVLMIALLIVGCWNGWVSTNKPLGFGWALLGWVVVAILGWQVFGAIVK